MPTAKPETPAQDASAAAAAPRKRGNRRRRRALGLLTVLVLVLLAACAWLVYDWQVLRHVEETDNAYVHGDGVHITPQVSGTVTAIHVDATERVEAGQVLVQLDAADAELALARAEAALGQAVRQVRTLYANNASLQAQLRLREAERELARIQVQRARQDLQRRQQLAGSGAVSAEELEHARVQASTTQGALRAAEAAVAAAHEQWQSNQALTEGVPVAQHPQVLVAAATVREAWLAVQRTALPAPVAGQVGQRTVQLGQRVAPGTPLMTVVPLERLWVEANFKENQLRRIRPGQTVELVADVYGKQVRYAGRVVGLGTATGAASALLPAQNATGNWIKVVQRVPVRIALDAQQLQQHPLRVGLSMLARVDVRSVADDVAADALAGGRTGVFEASADAAQARVQDIIARHLGASDASAAQVHEANAAEPRP